MKRLLAAALALCVPSFAQAQTTFANQPNVLQPLGATDFALVSQLVNGRNVTGKTTLGALWAGFPLTSGAIATALGYTPASTAGGTFTGNINIPGGFAYQIGGANGLGFAGNHWLLGSSGANNVQRVDTTDSAAGDTFVGLGKLSVQTGPNWNAITGSVIQDGTNGASSQPSGITGYGAVRSASHAAFGLFGRADCYTTGVCTNEVNSFNKNAVLGAGTYPPDRSSSTTQTVPVALTVAAGGDYPSLLGIQIAKEGGSPQQFYTGIYTNPDAPFSNGIFIDATSSVSPITSALFKNAAQTSAYAGVVIQTTNATPAAGSNALNVLKSDGTSVASITPAGVVNGSSYQINGTRVQLSALSYGVDPSGTTDSSTAMQAAVNAALALSNGATIKIPAGTYKIAAQVSIPKTTNKLVTFDCDAGAKFSADGALGVAMFYVGSNATPGGGSNVTVNGCTFTGANTTNTRAFKLENANVTVFRNNIFRSMYLPVEMISSYGVEFDANMFDTNTVYSLYSSTSAHHLFLHGNKFYNTGTGSAYTILLDGTTDNLIIRDNDAESGWTFLGLGAGGSALTMEGNYIEFFSNTPWFFASAVKGASIRQNWVALSGNLTLGNITAGSYVNNSSFNQTVAVNTGTTTDLQWSGNSLAGTGSLAYSGSIIVGNQNLSSGSSYQINGTNILAFTQSGTGATARTVDAREKDTVHLEDFCSATLLATAGGNITACLQNAINQAASVGRCLTMPATPSAVGYWSIASTLTIGNGSVAAGVATASTINNVCIKGAGSGGLYGTYGTYLKWSGASGQRFISIAGPINNTTIEGLNLNGNSVANTMIYAGASRFYKLHDIYASAFTAIGLDTEGLAATGALNIMLDWSHLYITTTAASADAVKFDGVLASSTDTWLSTIKNSRFESTGTSGTALHLAFSDNILFEQIHAIAGAGNCGVKFDASTSGTGGNSFPTGHLFVKSALDSTCTVEDGSHTIGVNNFIDFGTTDSEVIPTHAKLRGITDQGVSFGGYGGDPAWTTYTPTVTCSSGTVTSYTSRAGRYQISGKTVKIQMTLNISNIGTCVQPITASLPAAVNSTGVIYPLSGYDASLGTSVTAYAASSPAGLNFSVTPAAHDFIANGIYEAQ